ncbi:hypothetical protein IV203_019095 [Nitzschia inconspicua]|uniref:Uncharacterized protein n=1 Tax=Nitzschia inconspicua TaxID=303405 RepID=A0A9K3Q4X4_9STRA|nr:hypothetical protein IV203_019095 [Nitzschia inconspicua]
MDSLLERIEENKLDALYLFMTETLRDRTEFDRFISNLFSVLPHNWSIQRVEVGHEFLSMCTQQDELFSLISGLESLKGLIISDGYIPRKDNGALCTDSFLTNLPRARNLQYLDIQRLRLADESQVELLAEGFECVQDSLEEIRITGIFLGTEEKNDVALPSLDAAIQACVEMSHLRSLAVSCNTPVHNSATILSKDVLMDLCQSSSTLQDLALRAMHLDDDTCTTIAEALITNSFLTSLDIRQNPNITVRGYKAILGSLERNYDLWCSVMVDNESFQAKFNALIELNQANRGDLVRSPTREKLTAFLERLQDSQPDGDPTSLWYFLTIHDSILHPLVSFLKFKSRKEETRKEEQQANTNNHNNTAKRPAITVTDDPKRQKVAQVDDITPT